MPRKSAHQPGHSQRGRRFRPQIIESSLEARVLLSVGPEALQAAMTASGRRAAVVAPLARTRRISRQFVPIHITPAAVVNAEYAKFAADFTSIENAYITAMNSQSSNTVSVSSSLTAPYVVSTPQLQVQNGSVFGPNGVFSTPITAFASINSVPVATFVVTGRSGNTLILDSSQLPTVSVPTGAFLAATVPASSQTSAAALFPAYIANRTGQMANDLVSFFNQTKLRLPYYNNPPHTPNQRGAIQTFVYGQIVGTQISSLQQSLLLVPLPTTSGSDLVIYDAAINAAIEQSRTSTLNGIRQIYSGQMLISSPTIANRFGVVGGGTAGGATGGTAGGGAATGGAGGAGGTTGGATTAG